MTSRPGTAAEVPPANWAPLVACGVLGLAVAVLFVTAPKAEDFWWTDAATFALNGELIRDYVASAAGHSPMAFAATWFLRYPALTISLYPPIFPMVEAAVFAVFGFSHPAAQATVAGFAALAAFGAYRMVRTAAPPLAAAGAALVLFATPEVMLWSRQVVMEVPTLAFLLLASATLLIYQESGRTSRLFGSVILLLCAVYTKQTAIFAAPAFAAALLIESGVSLLRRRTIWLAAALGIVGLLPLVAFTVMFAWWDVVAAVGAGTASTTGDIGASHVSIAAFTNYGRALPQIVGAVPLVGAVGYLVLVAIRGWAGRPERRLAVLMLSWFVADYLFISATGHFEHRYGTFLTVPAAVLSILLVMRAAALPWRSGLGLAAGMALFAVAIVANPVHRIAGYDAVAAYVVDHAAQDNVVLFHGKDSKNFVFSVRTRTPVPKLFILRAEKLLVNYNIQRELGISDRNLSAADIEAIIDRYGIVYVVLQPDFWTDQPSIAKLQALVYSDRFTKVAEFPITSDDMGQASSIRVYRNTRPTEPTDRSIRLEIPALNGAISGKF